MVELIPVLDLAGGRAVHARGGDRAAYAPVRSALSAGPPGDALALARAYCALPGVRRCYVADLDAIGGGTVQRDLLAALAAPDGFGPGLVVDAGVADLAAARPLAGVAREVVVGLETLRDFRDLSALAEAGLHPVFSLDLRAGVPLARPDLRGAPGRAPAALARTAREHGAAAIIVLDLARVGGGAGTDAVLLRQVRAAVPGLPLLAGGGVGHATDLDVLAALGVDGALVATALHDGRLDPAALAARRGQSPGSASR